MTDKNEIEKQIYELFVLFTKYPKYKHSPITILRKIVRILNVNKKMTNMKF